MSEKKQTLPAQTQDLQPGRESKMTPKPEFEKDDHKGTDKLLNKVAIITGADSGIGRAVAVAFAKEGCDIVIMFLNEEKDAKETQKHVEKLGRKSMLIAGDIGDEKFCIQSVEKVAKEFGGKIDILVNNAAEQHPQKNIEDITEEQLTRTFRTNIFSMFFLTKAVLKYMKEGSSIINSTSVTAYRGCPGLLDYSSTKGAIVAFNRSLALNLVDRKIRVNGVAPGPIWTPLIPSTFDEEKVKTFGSETPMKRPGQPEECAPSYLFLASSDSTYITGQVIHVNGGEIING
jgi:NAD(P)-dependent dehydrogenase (short-subunit alcohol dehydrogenase family)